MLTRRTAPTPNSQATARDSTVLPSQQSSRRWPRAFFATTALVPLGYELLKVDGGGLSPFGVMSAVALLSGILICLQARLARRNGLVIVLAALVVMVGQLGALWSVGIEFFLTAVAMTWLAAGLWLFESDARQLSVAAVTFAFIVFFLAVLEMMFAVRSLGVTIERQGQIGERDPELSYRHPRNAVVQERAFASNGELVFDVTYHIENDRTRRVPGQPVEGPEWWILGGSFVFGHGLRDDETIAAQLQDVNREVRIVNHGHMGHGTADVYLYSRRLLAEGGKPSLVLYLLMDSHFWRTAAHDAQTALGGGSKPRFALVGGRLVLQGKAGETLTPGRRIRVQLFGKSGLYHRLAGRPRFNAAQVLPLMTALIVEMDAACREVPGCRFLLVRVPRREQVSEVRGVSSWMAGLRQRGVAAVDLKETFDAYIRQAGLDRDDYFIPHDMHPNVRYTRLIADWLYAQSFPAPDGEPPSGPLP